MHSQRIIQECQGYSHDHVTDFPGSNLRMKGDGSFQYRDRTVRHGTGRIVLGIPYRWIMLAENQIHYPRNLQEGILGRRNIGSQRKAHCERADRLSCIYGFKRGRTCIIDETDASGPQFDS